jgi:DNA gyrase/topoisomerase IV subunit B
MATPRGGTHVNYVVSQLVKQISDFLAKHHAEVAPTVTASMIKSHLQVGGH